MNSFAKQSFKILEHEMNGDEEDEEEFVDALEEQPLITEMNLLLAMEQAIIATNLFLDNKFEKARTIFESWRHSSLYHALGCGTIYFFKSVMTFDDNDINIGINYVSYAVQLSNNLRRKKTFTENINNWLKRVNYEMYTDEELHAELCYAESLLMKALLTFIEDETLVSFIKGSMRIKTCYNSYRECIYASKTKTTWKNNKSKTHFDSGVFLGIGTFNLLMSLLPPKILKILEFVGFSGRKVTRVSFKLFLEVIIIFIKDKALDKLYEGFMLQGSLRQMMCGLVLLFYHTIAIIIYGCCDPDYELCQEITSHMTSKYPEGALTSFFLGRYYFLRGEFDIAIHYQKFSYHSQNEWRQFHHICFWELMWCFIIKMDWINALHFCNLLLEESYWSRSIYAYQKACLLLIMNDDKYDEQKDEIFVLMESVCHWKQRIAGKSVPMEKFAAKKAQRVLSKGAKLYIPLIEFMYLWNMFKILENNKDILRKYLTIIDNCLEKSISEETEYYWDTMCLLYCLRGTCLHHLGELSASQYYLEKVINCPPPSEDIYLLPYSLVELAILHLSKKNFATARKLLEQAKDNYHNYSLESRLHFRIFAYLDKLDDLEKKTK